jgi:HEPN domain-containing protein
MGDLSRGKLVRGESARVWDYTSDAHSWHQWAEATYRAADVLFNNGDPFLWFGAAVLGHQSVEMFLKAILIGKGHRVIKCDVWGHDLLDLMKQVEQSSIHLPPEFEEDFRVFNSFFNELRYPFRVKRGFRAWGGRGLAAGTYCSRSSATCRSCVRASADRESPDLNAGTKRRDNWAKRERAV